MQKIIPITLLVLVLATACASPTAISSTATEAVRLPSDTPTSTLPTYTPIPSSTPTAAPSPTPTEPPRPALLAPLPETVLLSPENISKVEPLLAVPSEPQLFDIQFSDDGNWMMVSTLSGAQIYDTSAFEVKKVFSNNFAKFVDLYRATPRNIYRMIPGTAQVIANAELVWDMKKGKKLWSDPSIEPLQTSKKYFGFPNIWEKRGEGSILARSFLMDLAQNGKFAITGYNIWDLEQQKTENLNINSDPHQIIISPDGSRYAVTLSADDAIHLFTASDSLEYAAFPNPAGENPWRQAPLFFTSDSAFLLVQSDIFYQGGHSDLWTVYNAQNGTWVGEIRPPLSNNIQPGASYYFLKGDSPLAWQSCDLHIYSVWPQKKQNVLKIPAEPATCNTDWHPTYHANQFFGNLLVTVTHNEKEYRLNAWNVETGQMLLNQPSPEVAFVLSAQKDGQFFAFYKPDSGVIEIYGADGALRKTLEGYYNFSVNKVIHSADGKFRALLQRDSVLLIDTSAGKVVHNFRPASAFGLMDAVFSADASTLLVAGIQNQWLYSTADGSLLKSAHLPFGSLNTLPGTNLAVIGSGQDAILVDLTSLERLKSFPAPGNQLGATAISSDGSFVAVSGQRNPSVFLYSVDDARVKQQFPILKFAPNWMQFSPDGKNLYVADIETDDFPDHRNMLQIWELTTGKMTLELEITPNWLANYIPTDEFKGTDFLLKSVSPSPDGSFMLMRIRALDTVKTGIWKDRHLLVFWHIGEDKPFAVWKSIDSNSDQSEWLEQSGTTTINYAIPDGIPAFSPDGKYLIFDREWWGIQP